MIIILSVVTCLICYSDFKYLKIDNWLIFIPYLLIVVLQIILKNYMYLINGFIIFTILFLMMFLGTKIFNNQVLGGADVKLGLIIGSSLNFMNSLLCLIFAILLSLIYLYLFKKDKSPLGAFMMISLMFVLIIERLI